MVKRCHNCRSENPDNAFWCEKCNTKLLDKVSVETESIPIENNNPLLDYHLQDYPSYHQSQKIGLKIIASIVVTILLIAGIIAYLNWYSVSGFDGINCKINEDFWFEGNILNTSDGWTFTITKVSDYTLDGIVLALKTYNKNNWPYSPANIFSPIDLVIGTEDIKDNVDNYQYSITSFKDRIVSWYLHYDSIDEYNYFKSHTGNNHIIPHNEEVLNALTYNISVKDCVFIEGSLVNLYGTRGTEWWEWKTDTHIGDYDCEIILVDKITINDCSTS